MSGNESDQDIMVGENIFLLMSSASSNSLNDSSRPVEGENVCQMHMSAYI